MQMRSKPLPYTIEAARNLAMLALNLGLSTKKVDLALGQSRRDETLQPLEVLLIPKIKHLGSDLKGLDL